MKILFYFKYNVLIYVVYSIIYIIIFVIKDIQKVSLYKWIKAILSMNALLINKYLMKPVI